jgi:hypothetical protein
LQVNFRPRVFDAGLVYLLRHCHRVSLFGNRSTSSSVCTARMPTRDDRVALVLPPSLRRARGFIDWRHVGARRGGVTPARTRQAWPAGGEGDDCSRAYIEREGREMMPAGGGAALQHSANFFLQLSCVRASSAPPRRLWKTYSIRGARRQVQLHQRRRRRRRYHAWTVVINNAAPTPGTLVCRVAVATPTHALSLSSTCVRPAGRVGYGTVARSNLSVLS